MVYSPVRHKDDRLMRMYTVNSGMVGAPRLMAWWQRAEGASIQQMQRQDWNTVIANRGIPVKFDVGSTPLARLADSCSVVAAVAERKGKDLTLSIYRYDPKDAPNPVNQDQYRVLTDLRSYPQLRTMIAAASTEYNRNLETFCDQNVFLIKQPPGRDHHLPYLPSSLSLL